MRHNENTAVDLQRAYYERTAQDYRNLHEAEHSAHDQALQLILPLLRQLDVRSVLDVGAGTGRALRFFAKHRSDLALHGIEPVPALIRQAEDSGLPAGIVRQGSGEALDFPTGSIDVVTSFGVLHHVPQPAAVIREMMRVARRAIFISDGNRFAQGSPLARYVKLSIHALGLWPAFDFVRTRGRGYMTSEGDGVFYSYSVFDSLRLLRSWSPELMVAELETAPVVAGAWAGPLCNASSVLIGAMKKPSVKDSP
jgi:SAM-dependent methyltransferase